jgi:hypothetical protein
VQKVLIDRRELTGQLLIEEAQNLRITLHYHSLSKSPTGFVAATLPQVKAVVTQGNTHRGELSLTKASLGSVSELIDGVYFKCITRGIAQSPPSGAKTFFGSAGRHGSVITALAGGEGRQQT